MYVQGPPQWTPQPYYVVQPARQWGPAPVPQMMPPMMPQEQKSDFTSEERAVFR